MSSSLGPLSPSKRANDADGGRTEKEAKRARREANGARKEEERMEGAAAAPGAAAPAEASAAKPSAARLSTQEIYDRSDPSCAIRPLSEVDPKWQYQLHVRCENAKVGYLTKSETHTEEYNNGSYAYRDLVMSGNASGFDLVKTLLCAFGLSDAPFNHANGLGSLNVGHRNSWDDKMCNDNSMMLFDLLLKYEESTRKIAASTTGEVIRGLHVPRLPANRVAPSVTAAQLKSVKLCQLLDKPMYSSSARSRDAGVRTAIFLCVSKPERAAFVSHMGGAVERVAQAQFGFAVTLEVIGTKEHMASSFQARFPRCVGGAGKVHGGNEIDSDDDDEEVDELNCTFNNGRHVAGLMGGSGDPDEDVWCIRNWLRMPLFDVDEDEGVARCMARS